MGITNPFSRVRVPTALSRTDIERTRILREQKKPTSKPIAPTDTFTTAKTYQDAIRSMLQTNTTD